MPPGKNRYNLRPVGYNRQIAVSGQIISKVQRGCGGVDKQIASCFHPGGYLFGNSTLFRLDVAAPRRKGSYLAKCLEFRLEAHAAAPFKQSVFSSQGVDIPTDGHFTDAKQRAKLFIRAVFLLLHQPYDALPAFRGCHPDHTSSACSGADNINNVKLWNFHENL